jgi:hypothetical protein
LFFVWIGIVLMAKVSSSVTLLGIGVITLGVQLARAFFRLKVEGFWCVVGACFLLGGVWQWFDEKLPLVPVLLIAGGLAVLLVGFLPKRRKQPAE